MSSSYPRDKPRYPSGASAPTWMTLTKRWRPRFAKIRTCCSSGEMRSRRSVEVAIQAGESGHLCISTFHTADVTRTVARISTMVPEEHRKALLGRLAENLKVVISQRLLPIDGRRGRILAAEVMVMSASLKEAIRDPAQHKNITPLIAREATGTNNITLDQTSTC